MHTLDMYASERIGNIIAIRGEHLTSDHVHLEWHVCCWCVRPKKEAGDSVAPDEQHPLRDHNLYSTLSNANTKEADAKISSRNFHQGFNMFQHIPSNVSDHSKPDLLHTIQIGLLDHLQKWIIHFMKMHKQLDKYNAIWLSVPAYHDLTPLNKSYEEDSQWNGEEMEAMCLYLLGVVTQSLRGGSPTQCHIFNHAIECTWTLLEFYIYAQFNSHNDATLSYMEDALHRVHTFKDVFLLERAGNMAKAKANALRTEFGKI
jgi:hypothetical protein